ncbi:peptidoglycan editing factor PgeF [Campylobacter ureolyticus]|uniref:Purine nucleoside phosphorylase n=1 Tax=Campylobacter ureolyticus TaxID=827 RepID=A0AAE7EAZ8_9BACT|nr:peptidoglycan editing factor PgeF [Campylobacter ureolyticus]MCR8684479.1 peptidoglycan editing factor PgeF [Campylobacter ureolyticus]QKF84876.1 multi-copper polyphenol oxidoreductase laccase [Campylobacter ureolyticus]QQY34957.1 peptidoglycan editing factor PgeF [Campylobacter ureolyticus]SUX20798.1 laccase [Campylobacter ureolyticus]
MGRSGENFKSLLDDKIINSGFTNRFAGVSKKPFDSLNFGYHVGDDAKNVRKNREILKRILGVKKAIFMEQIHSDKVEIYKNLNQILPPCDAVITNLKNIALCVMVADCMPVILYSNKCVAAVHAGRSGVIKGIILKTINLMKSEFNAGEIHLKIGPFIQKNCYEIGNLDLGEFNKFVHLNQENKRCFDLKSAVLDEIKNLNLKSVEISQICTHCDKNYFSYRREKTTGRFIGFVYLN